MDTNNKKTYFGVLSSGRIFLAFGAFLPAMLLLAPIVFLIYQATGFSQILVDHILKNLLFEAFGNTTKLLIGVLIISSVLGIISAWILARFEFPLARFWRWSILLPLSLPTYVMAFVWVSWMDYSGLVPTFLRGHFDSLLLNNVFSNFRSVAGILIPMSLSLFPYMYLLVFEGLESQSRNINDVARSLGLNRMRRFFKLEMPIVAPWIASGFLLVGMETLADFGSVSIFNLNVFTTIVYRSWFGLQSIETASFFSLIHVVFLILFVALVLWFSRRRKYSDPYVGRLNVPRKTLTPLQAFLANLFLVMLFVVSFVFPVAQLVFWSSGNIAALFDSRLFERILNSFFISGGAALVAVLFASLLVVATRVLQSQKMNVAEKISSLGYGVPGTVIAVGWMASIAYFFGATNFSPLFGVMALMLGLSTRFLALAQRPVMSASSKISSSIEESSLISGASIWKTFLKIHFPLLKNAFLLGFLFVFIDSLKEMPMTLLMRPYGWDTLAVRVYQFTSEGMWAAASAPALTIVIVSVVPIFLLRRQIK